MLYVGVLTAAVASWLAGAVWYNVFGNAWLVALGKTKAELMGPSGKPSPVPFVFSFLAEVVMAFVLAIILPRLGAVTILGGITAALMIWVGFVITSIGVNHAYTNQKPALTAIDGGHWLAVLLIQGAILGAFGVR